MQSSSGLSDLEGLSDFQTVSKSKPLSRRNGFGENPDSFGGTTPGGIDPMPGLRGGNEMGDQSLDADTPDFADLR